MKKIVLASNNEHKIKEFKEILKNFEIITMKEVGFYDDIVEDGTTFEENSEIKADAILKFLKSKNLNYMVMADDSGLCVNALNGAPGVYSARYAQVHNDQANRDKLLENLKNATDRSAYFMCVITVKNQMEQKLLEKAKLME